jgi:hypothetical protein
MNIVEIRNVAEQVQKAFFNIKLKIIDKKIEDSLLQVILTLPKNPSFRFKHFPHGCCVDASHFLAEILSCINYLNIHAITCIEASSEKDNHMWVDCDGIAVDITYGQDDDLYFQKVFISEEHPYLNKPGYKIIRHEPIKTELAQYIKETYMKV